MKYPADMKYAAHMVAGFLIKRVDFLLKSAYNNNKLKVKIIFFSCGAVMITHRILFLLRGKVCGW